jgi:Sap, sulfolipid-1-addressing protein
MWPTILLMAVAVSLEPFRIGMSVLMLNRPRPHLQLAAFLGGGYLMGLTVGAVVVFALASRLAPSPQFTLPRVQVVLGTLALIAAAILLVWRRDPRPRTAPAWLQRLLGGQSLWVAGIAGLSIALPSVDYLAALAVIASADVTPATQLGALVVFNFVAFALVEIPLLAYLVAPARTRSAMTALHAWVRARRRHEAAAMLGFVGGVLLLAGLLGGA